MSPKRILFVEDEVDLNRYFKLALEAEGFTVKGVFQGRDALDVLSRENFDLVLLDIILPDQDGIEILKEIRQRLQLHQLPICMITGSLEVERVYKAFQHGANGYIVKPFDLDELLLKIQELLPSEHDTSP